MFSHKISIPIKSNKKAVEFFISNNTQTMSIKSALDCLKNGVQKELNITVLNAIQKEHLIHGKFENLLGFHHINEFKSNEIMAENSEEFFIYVDKKFTHTQIISVAKKLSVMLKQENVALFIPCERHIIGQVFLEFHGYYSIEETIQHIQTKLPWEYQKAFSIHLHDTNYSDKDSIVEKIEWLGSSISPKEIRKHFPNDTVVYNYGKAYLVYKDGQAVSL